MTIAAALQKCAKKRRLSDVQIAAAVGVSEATVGRWRRGLRRPGGVHLLKLMSVFEELHDMVEVAA